MTYIVFFWLFGLFLGLSYNKARLEEGIEYQRYNKKQNKLVFNNFWWFLNEDKKPTRLMKQIKENDTIITISAYLFVYNRSKLAIKNSKPE